MLSRRAFIKQAAAGAALPVLATGAETAAQEGPRPFPEPFVFAVLADPHCSEGPKEGIERFGNGVDKLLACVRAMEGLPENDRPDFALVLGDLHAWAAEQALPAVKIPLHVIAGNHESTPEKRAQLRRMFPKDFLQAGKESDYYCFMHKGVRFVGMCDAGLGGEHVGQFCSENITPRGQCAWLETTLANQDAPAILFAHIPPDRTGEEQGMFLNRNDSRWFTGLVQRTRPAAMFFGHLHHATEEYQIGTTLGFNVRSCCWNFNRAPLGFLLVRVAPDGLTVREIETAQYAPA